MSEKIKNVLAVFIGAIIAVSALATMFFISKEKQGWRYIPQEIVEHKQTIDSEDIDVYEVVVRESPEFFLSFTNSDKIITYYLMEKRTSDVWLDETHKKVDKSHIIESLDKLWSKMKDEKDFYDTYIQDKN